MSFRRFLQILAILSAFAISMSGPLATSADACNSTGSGGDC
jgi:hypothetical protein